ncbi:hypothetical protein BY996DRAFT_6539181 [Phakopsora pachyrhizi]|nr:hypothetical protein BY996DRAFT_6539181 [Phakopsora pachyrhizi]
MPFHRDELVAELAELGPGFGAGLAAEADLELAAGFAGVELRLAEADPLVAIGRRSMAAKDGLEAMEGCGGPERRWALVRWRQAQTGVGPKLTNSYEKIVEDWRGQYLQVRTEEKETQETCSLVANKEVHKGLLQTGECGKLQRVG